jgi:hypothetical protein
MNDLTTPAAAAAASEAKAAAHDQAAAESFARCDTDGFVSQWAHSVLGQEARLQAEIDRNGGRHEFPALFDLDGNLVAAKLIDGQYGMVWGVFASDDLTGRVIAWVAPSYAAKAATRNRNMAKKGYTEGRVLAPAKAELGGGGSGLAGAMNVRAVARRTDGGFSRDVEVVSTIATRDF